MDILTFWNAADEYVNSMKRAMSSDDGYIHRETEKHITNAMTSLAEKQGVVIDPVTRSSDVRNLDLLKFAEAFPLETAFRLTKSNRFLLDEVVTTAHRYRGRRNTHNRFFLFRANLIFPNWKRKILKSTSSTPPKSFFSLQFFFSFTKNRDFVWFTVLYELIRSWRFSCRADYNRRTNGLSQR